MSPMGDRYRVVFCGGRDYNDILQVHATLMEYDANEVIVVHGAARGADRLVGQQARKMGFVVEEYPAPWEVHGKRAGYLRNLQMASLDDVVEVVAFPGGVGTAMMLQIAEERGIPHREVR